MRRIALLVGIAACGRVRFDARSDGGADAVPRCTQWSAFSTPVRLPGPINSPSDDWDPAPAQGQLALYFFSYRTGSLGADLWFAQRASTADAFAAPARIVELDTAGDEREPSITEDGLDLVFGSTTGTTTAVLLETSRGSTSDPFAPAQQIAELTSGHVDTLAWIDANGTRLVFASDRIGPSLHGLDLFETTRAARGGTWAPPVVLAPLNTDKDDFAPALSSDGLDIYFASRRADAGFADIYTSHRVALDQPFAAPAVVTELSTPNMDDVSPRLSADDATIYLNYDTLTSGGANADIWTATRTCLAH